MNRVGHRKLSIALLCGFLGCLCYGAGDWLMVYGDTTYTGKLFWLTSGVAGIPAWRNELAMALAFPGIILYGIALFAIGRLITGEKARRVYHYLNAFGLTPWLCLHLFYIMILYLFGWMTQNGYAGAALPACEALYDHLSWLIPVSEGLMLPVFLYWFYAVLSGKTVLPKRAAIWNVLTFYAIFSVVKNLLPDNPFRIGFTNGLMSESMVLFFLAIWLAARKAEW